MTSKIDSIQQLQDLIDQKKEQGLINVAAFPVSVDTPKAQLAAAMVEMLGAKTLDTEESL